MVRRFFRWLFRLNKKEEDWEELYLRPAETPGGVYVSRQPDDPGTLVLTSPKDLTFEE
jgi:hypothetical protein